MATSFETMRLPERPDAIAPDGSEVRVLLALEGGSFAHFQLAPGETSVAAANATRDEIWYFVTGEGEMWRGSALDAGDTVEVGTGTCITIPARTHFQFRSTGDEPLAAVAVTMPPWPEEGDAYLVAGPWEATVGAGPGAIEPPEGG